MKKGKIGVTYYIFIAITYLPACTYLLSLFLNFKKLFIPAYPIKNYCRIGNPAYDSTIQNYFAENYAHFRDTNPELPVDLCSVTTRTRKSATSIIYVGIVRT